MLLPNKQRVKKKRTGKDYNQAGEDGNNSSADGAGVSLPFFDVAANVVNVYQH